jgi:hypothetical protein
MKTKPIAAKIFVATAATVAFFPAIQQAIATTTKKIKTAPAIVSPVTMPSIIANQHPQIEVVFVLDTTGSIGGLIAAAKEKIWSIASTMASAQTVPEIKMGLVAYRDRGDAYVTQAIALSTDLDSMYAKLMDFQADGGSDGPESVNQALHDAVHNMTWSQNPNTYKVIFLVGDAPPPYDKKLAELSSKLDKTRFFYGNDEERARQAGKMAATDKLHKESSTEAQARLATFNASASGKANLLGENELVAAVAGGRVKLSSLPKKSLPESLQVMSPAAQEEFVGKTKKERGELESEIKQLAEQRNDYLQKKVVAEGGKKDSLDTKLYGAIRNQAKEKGLVYEADSAKY